MRFQPRDGVERARKGSNTKIFPTNEQIPDLKTFVKVCVENLCFKLKLFFKVLGMSFEEMTLVLGR